MRHPDSENFERENVTRWLTDHIAAGVKFITQNGIYDWGWLRTDLGIIMPPSEQLEEIGALATLIDENRSSYSLDSLCAWRGLPGKDTALLEEAIKAAGFAPKPRRSTSPSTSTSCRRTSSAPTLKAIRSPRWGYMKT